jgi:hypothetical protein
MLMVVQQVIAAGVPGTVSCRVQLSRAGGPM